MHEAAGYATNGDPDSPKPDTGTQVLDIDVVLQDGTTIGPHNVTFATSLTGSFHLAGFLLFVTRTSSTANTCSVVADQPLPGHAAALAAGLL